MPSKSQAQHNMMAMVAHDPAAAERLGIPQSVGEDFVQADKGKNTKKMPRHVPGHMMAAALKKHMGGK